MKISSILVCLWLQREDMARLETRGAGVRASNVPKQRARITCRCAPNRTPSRDDGDGVARRLVVSGLVSVGLGLGLGLKSPVRAEEGKYERTKLGVPYEEVYGEPKSLLRHCVGLTLPLPPLNALHGIKRVCGRDNC